MDEQEMGSLSIQRDLQIRTVYLSHMSTPLRKAFGWDAEVCGCLLEPPGPETRLEKSVSRRH